MEIITRSAQETTQLGGRLAKKTNPGAIIALFGDLGAGKTTFIQGLLSGLGYKKRVSSPTFIVMRPYYLEGNSPLETIYHIDLYRLEKVDDLKTVGIEEFLQDPKGASVIEWPEKIESLLPKETIEVKFQKLSENERKVTTNLDF
jgi:tRNA threonylcarbamoyladenosine biosynthesis protein TsaE